MNKILVNGRRHLYIRRITIMSGADQFMMIGFNLNIFVLKASNVALAGLLF